MTGKAYYQNAVDEVARGHIDQALWAKVNAQYPGASPVFHQAKYIDLRAREIQRYSWFAFMLSWAPTSLWRWVGYITVAVILFFIVGSASDSLAIAIIASTVTIVIGLTLSMLSGRVITDVGSIAAPAAQSSSPPDQAVDPFNNSNRLTNASNDSVMLDQSLSGSSPGLAFVYWIYGVVPGVVISMAAKVVIETHQDIKFYLAIVVIYAPYYLFFFTPRLWRSASTYTGWKIWSALAIGANLFGLISIPVQIVAAYQLMHADAAFQYAPSNTHVSEPAYRAPAVTNNRPSFSDSNAEYNREAAMLENKYAELNPRSPSYNDQLVKQILALENKYELQGMRPADALDDAAQQVIFSQ